MHPIVSCLALLGGWAAQHAIPEFKPASFLAPGAREIQLKPEAAGWNGKRVRVAGFMAQFEDETPLTGGFLLTQIPVVCDESGGGHGDLPISSVFVIVESQKGRPIEFILGRLSVSGTLKVGSLQTERGTVLFQLILDSAPPKVKS